MPVRARRLGLCILASLCLVACGVKTTAPPQAAQVQTESQTQFSASSTAPSTSAPAAAISEITMTSPALGGAEVHYRVVHPAQLEPGRAYPVLYLLHGAYGSYVDWTDRTPLLELHAGRPFLIVTPDGSQFGWYVDSPTQPNSSYETFLTHDLLEDVASRFPVLDTREGRGIAGLSMGGHGALSIAALHPDLFSSASSLSGILNLVTHAHLDHAERWKLNDTLSPFDDNPAFWEAHSVYHLVDRFVNADVALLFDTGIADQTGAVEDNRQVHERLTNRAIVHAYHEFPGAHTWNYWAEHIPEHLDFHLKNFADRTAGTPPTTGQHIQGKWHQHYVDRALTFEKENEGSQQPHDKESTLVLLGSSSIEHMALYEDLPDYVVANRGISADGLGIGDRGILHRLYCSVFNCNPRAVVLLNGRNDLGGTMRRGTPTLDETADAYALVVRRIREKLPDTPIFLVACFPTRDKYEPMAGLVRDLDTRIRAIAEAEGDLVHFVDTWTPFADEQGLLKQEYSADGLHLNRKGHEVFSPILRESLIAHGIQPDIPTR